MHDRTLTSAFFAPSESEADPSSLFSTGPYRYRTIGDAASGSFSGVTLTELYAHPYSDSVGTAPGLASLRPAVENVAPIQLGVVGRSPASDIQGRLFLTTLQDQALPSSGSEPYVGLPSPYGITRYDPRTGKVGPVMANALRFSPSRARVFAGDLSNGLLLDLQGSRDLTGVSDPVFVGEDFYYVAVARSDAHGPASSSTLTRIQPNAEPEALLSSSGSLSITAIQGGQTPQLLVQQSPATGPLPGLFMLDLDTLASTPLPSELGYRSFLSASASGRWLLFVITTVSSGAEPRTQTHTLVDWTTGARTDLSPSLVDTSGTGSPPEWRPGHDELWIPTDNGTFKITEPGDLVTAVSMDPGLRAASLQEAGSEWFSIFTRDGQHWFSRGADYSGPVYLGWVDDPASPPVQINPQGAMANSYWDIGDGRLLAGASTEDEGRQELFLVDSAAGTTRALAGGGQVVAVGKTRALALLEWDGGRNSGTLTLIDLASGAQTLLAEDVYLAAVDPGHFADVPPDTDVLAPGTEIAFLSRGRFASPYDGLWVTQLP